MALLWQLDYKKLFSTTVQRLVSSLRTILPIFGPRCLLILFVILLYIHNASSAIIIVYTIPLDCALFNDLGECAWSSSRIKSTKRIDCCALATRPKSNALQGIAMQALHTILRGRKPETADILIWVK